MSPSKTTVYPTYRIASIPADGIGPEVIEAGVKVLEKLASTLKTFKLEFENFDWSSDYYKKHGKYLPDDALVTLKKFDAILFGAVGAPGELSTPRTNLTSNTLIHTNRCSRSYLSLGLASCHMSTSSTIRKRASYEGFPRNQVALE